MRTPWDPQAKTPFDTVPWPTTLEARVVEGARVHGYDAVDDLARHYRYSDVVFLSLTGELPSDAVSRAFELALTCLAPTSVAEAPAHAGVLARVCDGAPSAVVATSTIALAEQARVAVAEWLEGRGDERAPDPAAARLRAAVAELGLGSARLDRAASLADACLAVFLACGLERADQLERAWVFARLPVVTAEAFASKAGAFRDYPLDVPPFAYSEDQPEGEPR